MAFIRFKHTGGIFYVYLVESHWDKTKRQSRQKVLKYLGKAPRFQRLDWPLIQAVFARDNFTCQLCARKEYLVIDHKISLLDGGDNVEENLWVLCSWCNARKGRKAVFEQGPKISTIESQATEVIAGGVV